MTDEQIIEANKLIAEFMGGGIQHGNMVYFTYWQDNHRYFKLSDLKYKESWNWLMLVVEKISKIPLIGGTEPHDVCYPLTFGMPHTDGTLMVRFKGSFINYGETLIEATWLAVVEFIKNLNKDSQHSPAG